MLHLISAVTSVAVLALTGTIIVHHLRVDGARILAALLNEAPPR